MSRSLVGSSSSSTFGSPASSRSSCSRRRSPPDRSATGVHSRRSVKPNTSASCAGGQLPAAEVDPPGHLLDRLQHPRRARAARPAPGTGTPAARSSRCVDPPPSTGRVPASTPQQGRLAGAVGARRCRSGHPARRASPRRSSSVRSPTRTVAPAQLVHLLAQPGGGQPAQRDRVAGLGHVGDQRVGRVDAELRLRRAGRRPPAQPGDLLAEQVLPAGLGGGGDPLPLGPGEDPGGVPALVRPHGLVGDLPRRGRRPRRGTTGRG